MFRSVSFSIAGILPQVKFWYKLRTVSALTSAPPLIFSAGALVKEFFSYLYKPSIVILRQQVPDSNQINEFSATAGFCPLGI